MINYQMTVRWNLKAEHQGRVRGKGKSLNLLLAQRALLKGTLRSQCKVYILSGVEITAWQWPLGLDPDPNCTLQFTMLCMVLVFN